MMRAVHVLEYRGWSEFKRDFFHELFDEGCFRPGCYLFRGMGNADWRLSSSFDRQYGSLPPRRRLRMWEDLTAEWRRSCEEVGLPESVIRDDQKLWALGQHHGLPTRLLDWTTSPYVASFFAFRSAVLALPGDVPDVSIWALSLESPVWSPEMGVQIVTPPALENVRLRNQSGKFTMSRTPFASLEEYVEQSGGDRALIKAVLPGLDAVAALADLDAMGINNYQLFPDITGLAERARTRLALTLLAGERPS
jgi:hypothetical protein